MRDEYSVDSPVTAGGRAVVPPHPDTGGALESVMPAQPVQTLFRARFEQWRRTRPFASGLATILGGLLVIAGPLSLIRLAILPGSTIWMGTAVGALLVLMGVLQWTAPYYSLMTGAITVVLSIVSLLTGSFGGFVVGMLLGLVGGALGVAWQPEIPRELARYPASLSADALPRERLPWFRVRISSREKGSA